MQDELVPVLPSVKCVYLMKLTVLSIRLSSYHRRKEKIDL